MGKVEVVPIVDVLDLFADCSDDLLLAWADRLKGTDAEGWCIGELVRRVVRWRSLYASGLGGE
jgi:hypothetical protein